MIRQNHVFYYTVYYLRWKHIPVLISDFGFKQFGKCALHFLRRFPCGMHVHNLLFNPSCYKILLPWNHLRQRHSPVFLSVRIADGTHRSHLRELHPVLPLTQVRFLLPSLQFLCIWLYVISGFQLDTEDLTKLMIVWFDTGTDGYSNTFIKSILLHLPQNELLWKQVLP